jgi:hypothetical protein
MAEAAFPRAIVELARGPRSTRKDVHRNQLPRVVARS